MSLYAWLLPTVLGIGCSLIVPVLALPAPKDGPVAAIFPPWWRSADALTAAGSAGRIIRQGAFGFVVILAPDGADTTGRVRAAGALLVVDPILIGGCGAASAADSI